MKQSFRLLGRIRNWLAMNKDHSHGNDSEPTYVGLVSVDNSPTHRRPCGYDDYDSYYMFQWRDELFLIDYHNPSPTASVYRMASLPDSLKNSTNTYWIIKGHELFNITEKVQNPEVQQAIYQARKAYEDAQPPLVPPKSDPEEDARILALARKEYPEYFAQPPLAVCKPA